MFNIIFCYKNRLPTVRSIKLKEDITKAQKYAEVNIKDKK
jgi:hypothetical protein